MLGEHNGEVSLQDSCAGNDGRDRKFHYIKWRTACWCNWASDLRKRGLKVFVLERRSFNQPVIDEAEMSDIDGPFGSRRKAKTIYFTPEHVPRREGRNRVARRNSSEAACSKRWLVVVEAFWWKFVRDASAHNVTLSGRDISWPFVFPTAQTPTGLWNMALSHLGKRWQAKDSRRERGLQRAHMWIGRFWTPTRLPT